MLIEKIGGYVLEQRWQDVDNILLPLLDNKIQGLEAVLLYVSTLRARNQGNIANEALIGASRNRYAVSVQMWSQFAEELMQSGLWPQARDVISKISPVDTTTGNFLQLIFFRETENWSEFDKTFDLVYAQSPALALIQSAWADIRRGRLTQANERLIALTSLQDHPAVLKLRARFNIASGKLAEALCDVEAAKLNMPMDWECLALEGVCSPEQSVRLWEISLSRQPAQLETLVNLARHYAIQSNWDLAGYNCEAALRVKPWSDFPVLLWLNCLAAQQKTDEAWLYLQEKLIQLVTPGRLAAKLDLLRARNVKIKELKQAIDDALKRFPNDSQLLLSAGAALQQTRQLDRAALCYQKRLHLFPNDIATTNNLAQLYLDRGDIELAIETWHSVISEADDTVKLNFAQALLKRGDNFEAEQLFKDVTQRLPSNAIALRGLADIFAGAGDYAKAWSFTQNVIQIDPKHSRTWLLASNIQNALGHTKEVEAMLLQGEACSDHPITLRQALFNYWRGHNQIDNALKNVSNWLNQAPNEVEYPLMLADLQYDRNQFDDAERNLKQAFDVDWLTGGEALVRFYEQRERLGAARKLAEQLVRQDLSVMKHHGLLAEVLYRQERYQEALNAIDAGLLIEPYRLSLVRQKMGMLLAQEQYAQAIEIVQSLLNHEESIPNINLMLTAYRRSRQFSQAVDLCRQMLQKHPEHRVLAIWLASSLANAKCLSQSVDIMRESYEREPSNVKLAVSYIQYLINFESYQEAHKVAQDLVRTAGERPDSILMLAGVMRNMGDHEDVLALLERGLIAFPKHLGLAMRRIECLRRLDKKEEEKQAIWGLLDQFPAEQVLAWGSMRLLDLKAPEEAEKRLTQWQNDEGESLQPRWAAFHFLKKQKRFGVALQLLDTIERRKPADTTVLLSRADIYSENWRMSEAINLVREARVLRPDSASIVQTLLNLLVKAGDFSEFDELMNRLKHVYGDLRYSQYNNFFFNINCHPTWSAEDIYQFYQDWYYKSVLPNKAANRPLHIDKTPNRKLRIGYMSPDFRRHAVAYFSEPLLINHDREQFELFGFAHLDLGASDTYTDRFKGYFDHWIETATMSGDELEKKIRECQIDILVDLAGHTANNSLNIFIRQPAPIQISYLFGAGQTTGLPEVDYLVGDQLAIPKEHQSFVAEKIAQLPFAGIPYCPPHDYLDPTSLPLEKNGYITFGVMSRPLRTNRQVFAVWAEILRQLPNAKIRFDHVPYAELDLQQRIKASFFEFGITEEQLIFNNTRPHWRVYQEIDIQLDPFPAGSGTTITEGIWMERVAIALRSRPPMGRIAVAQLSALNLEAFCCADSEADYIEKAVTLAKNPEQLRDISSNLREKMRQSRLMNYSAYAKDVAFLYRQMWEDYCKKEST
jgi:predicted O-linked N-acetylglucosamine transferase (SPINDLY family)/Tfp pilus assembly protein PilF